MDLMQVSDLQMRSYREARLLKGNGIMTSWRCNLKFRRSYFWACLLHAVRHSSRRLEIKFECDFLESVNSITCACTGCRAFAGRSHGEAGGNCRHHPCRVRR